MSGTVEKALKVLELLSTYDTPVRMAELSRTAGMNKSTMYRMLETMSQLGYVQQDEPDRRYMITTRMWEIGVRAFQRLDIRNSGRPFLERICAQTGETSILAIADDSHVIIIDKCDSSQSIQTLSTLGSRTPLHCSSLGKAVLMMAPEQKLSKLKMPLEKFTSKTIVDIKSLRKRLAAARQEGVATAIDEHRDGVSGVSAPVIGADGKVHCVVGITVPTIRMTAASLKRVKAIVRDRADEFSAALGHKLAVDLPLSGGK